MNTPLFLIPTYYGLSYIEIYVTVAGICSKFNIEQPNIKEEVE